MPQKVNPDSIVDLTPMLPQTLGEIIFFLREEVQKISNMDDAESITYLFTGVPLLLEYVKTALEELGFDDFEINDYDPDDITIDFNPPFPDFLTALRFDVYTDVSKAKLVNATGKRIHVLNTMGQIAMVIPSQLDEISFTLDTANYARGEVLWMHTTAKATNLPPKVWGVVYLVQRDAFLAFPDRLDFVTMVEAVTDEKTGILTCSALLTRQKIS